MRYLKQNTSVDLPIGPFLDSTDGVTAETGLTLTQPDIRLKKNGGNWAQKAAAQTLSHEENGYYEVTLDATDTDTLGQLRLAVHESGALPVWEDFMVMPANVWDSLFGADKLQVHADEITNNLITTAAINDGAITAAKLAADCITAAKIAADAITAAKLAADVATEINSAVLAILGTPAGASLAADLVVIDDFVDALESRLPATMAELTGVPSATPTLVEALMLPFMALRNKVTSTSTQQKFHKDDGTVIATAALSDDGTTFERGEFA